MKIENILFVLLLSVTLVSCGGDDDTSESNAIFSSLNAVNSKLAASSNLLDSATTVSSPIRPAALGIDDIWTTNPGVHALSNSGSTSLKTWMASQFNHEFENSNGARTTFAGRIASALNVMCFLSQSGTALEASTNLPAVGSHSIQLTSAMATACNETLDDEMLSSSIALTVTATTETVLYDRKLSFALPGSEACPFIVYARISDTDVNIAQAEDQICDGRDHASKTVIKYDVANKITKFMYHSQAFDFTNPTGFEYYRGIINETTDEGYIVGFYGGDDDGDTDFESGVSFTVAGKPSAGGTTAVSAKTINQTIGNATYNGCIDPVTVDVVTADSLNCTLTGTTATNTHGDVIQARYNAVGARSEIYNIGETATVGFTDETDVYTAGAPI